MKWSREDELEYAFDKRVLNLRSINFGLSVIFHMFYMVLIMCVFALPKDVLFLVTFLFQFYFATSKAHGLFSNGTLNTKAHMMEKNLYFPVTRANIVRSKVRIMIKHLLMEFALSAFCFFTAAVNYSFMKVAVIYGTIVLGVVVGFAHQYLMHRKELKQ